MSRSVESTIAAKSAHNELALDLKNISVEFNTDHGWVKVVDEVSFSANSGQVVGLVGESGSGKSVTNLSVLGLLPKRRVKSSGSAYFNGKDLLTLNQRELENIRGSLISMIFQEPMTSLNPAFTVGDQIAEVARRHKGLNHKDSLDLAKKMLDRVRIPNPAKRLKCYPHEFSGGMRQRVMIAMSLVCDPSVLIADEPTTALDVTTQAQILDLLRELKDDTSMAMVFVTHNLGVVADICDRVVVMYAGQIVEESSIYELFRQPRHPYTEGLLRSMPRLSKRAGDLPSISGSAPVPWNLPEGCRFAPRCPYAQLKCTVGSPTLKFLNQDQSSRCIRVDELMLKGTSK